MEDFISDDDIQTFEEFLKYQVPDPSLITSEELKALRDVGGCSTLRTSPPSKKRPKRPAGASRLS